MSKRASTPSGSAAVVLTDTVVAGGDSSHESPIGIAVAPSIIAVAAQRHCFAAVGARAKGAPASDIDFAPIFNGLELALKTLSGQPCRITIDPAPVEASAATTSWYIAQDGSWLGVALSIVLAEALVSLRHGGSLAGEDGRFGSSASVVRLHAELISAIVNAAAAMQSSSGGGWSPAPAGTRPPPLPLMQAATIHVGALRCPLGIALNLADAAGSTELPAAWSHDLRQSIERLAFPVRAVLFETRLPLAKAARLRPGDILPIETPRDVGLRAGAYRLASGTVSPADDGGHLVTIGASARTLSQPAAEKAPL